MSLESATYIGQLVDTNPTGTDPKSQGDDHLRLIKSVLQNQFGTATDGSVSVPGQVEAKATGFKFPDATAQASAAYTKSEAYSKNEVDNRILSVSFDGSGANGACPLYGTPFGIINVTKVGTGTYDVYFASAMASIAYVTTCGCDNTGPAFLALPDSANSNTLKARITTYTLIPSLADSSRIHVMIKRP